MAPADTRTKTEQPTDLLTEDEEAILRLLIAHWERQA
jgi:hypothetical protein